jgi:hypothetical protein
MLSIPEPAAKIKTRESTLVSIDDSLLEKHTHWPGLTQNECDPHQLMSDAPPHYLRGVVDPIDLAMVEFELAKNIASVGGKTSNYQHADYPWDHTKRIEGTWHRKNAQPNLAFHHQD